MEKYFSNTPFDREAIMNEIFSGKTTELIIEKLLIEIGFRSNLTGTHYLKDAILQIYQRGNSARVSLTREIYPCVALKHESTSRRVERSIRNTIHDCYYSGNLKRLNDLTQCLAVSPVYVPTNGDLLRFITAWIHTECRQRGLE